MRPSPLAPSRRATLAARASLAALTALGLIAARLGAQGPTRPAPRPDYLPSRFDERWPSSFAGARGLDALKHIPLLPDDRAYLTIGGQWRVRGEAVSHYLLGAGDDRSDAYGLDRVLVSADVHAGDTFRAFAELRDAQSLSRDLPGGARPNDRDRWDVQNAFADLHARRGALDVVLRGGRQEISIGRERLVGLADWSNGRRSYDGGRAIATWRGVRADAFLTRPVTIRQTERDRADTATTFWGATLGGALGRSPRAGARTWQLYALGLAQTRAALDGVAGAQRRLTLGGRAAGGTPLAWLAFDVEGAAQRGHVGDGRIAAGFAVAELTGTARSVRAAPSLTLGYDVSSGDRDSADRVLGTFVTLFPTSHSHGGFADVVGRQNSSELRAAVAATPARWLQARAGAHHFDRLRLDDAAYTKSGTVLRAASGSRTRDVGSELDLTATATANRHLKLLLGYGHFAPGAFLREAPSTSHPLDWGFAGTTFTF